MMAQTELCWFEPIRDKYLCDYMCHIIIKKKKSSISKFSFGGGIAVQVCVYLCLVGVGSL